MLRKNSCIIYCCVTNAEAGSIGNLAVQKKICRRYAAKQGYRIRHIFFDTDMSGDSLPTLVERPKLKNLLEFLEEIGSCKVIVSSRSILIGLKGPGISFVDAIETLGGEILVTTEDTDSGDPRQLPLRF